MNRPNRLAVRLVQLAVQVVPHEHRPRWERELIADLHDLSGRRQAAYALLTVATAWTLRRAVTRTDTWEDVVMPTPRKPLGCLLGRHHYELRYTEDGGRYNTCTRCGNDLYVGITATGVGF